MPKNEIEIPLPRGVRESVMRATRLAKEQDVQEARHMSAIERARRNTIAYFHLTPGDVRTLNLLMDEYPEVEREYEQYF